jgi:hypothetical protein
MVERRVASSIPTTVEHSPPMLTVEMDPWLG